MVCIVKSAEAGLLYIFASVSIIMVRSIVIVSPKDGSSVRADLWEEVEPELYEKLWVNARDE